jgi:copper chaperone NosL
MRKVILNLVLVSLFFFSCSPEPVPISYGNDMCHFCKMNIVDPQHGAELVTSKGKVFTFDAIECMINYKHKNQNAEFAFELVNVYNKPKELVAASRCYYLISKGLPSPMGANLTAFENEATAMQMRDLKEGLIYNWTEIQNLLVLKN